MIIFPAITLYYLGLLLFNLFTDRPDLEDDDEYYLEKSSSIVTCAVLIAVTNIICLITSIL